MFGQPLGDDGLAVKPTVGGIFLVGVLIFLSFLAIDLLLSFHFLVHDAVLDICKDFILYNLLQRH